MFADNICEVLLRRCYVDAGVCGVASPRRVWATGPSFRIEDDINVGLVLITDHFCWKSYRPHINTPSGDGQRDHTRQRKRH